MGRRSVLVILQDGAAAEIGIAVTCRPIGGQTVDEAASDGTKAGADHGVSPFECSGYAVTHRRLAPHGCGPAAFAPGLQSPGLSSRSGACSGMDIETP
jgi:hypothetical protein